MSSPAAGVALREGPGWAGPAREYLDSVVGWLDGPEAMGTGHGELEARLLAASRGQYRLPLQGEGCNLTVAAVTREDADLG